VNELRAAVLDLVRSKGLRHFDEPVQLSSGEYSQDFIDAKRALAQGRDLRTACEAMAEMVADAGVEFDAVGGLTLGADQFAHGIALVADKAWFVIRKQPKGRGTDQWVEGYRRVAPLSAEDEAELRTFVMFRRLLLLAWIGSHGDVDVAQELAPTYAVGSCHLAEEYLSSHT